MNTPERVGLIAAVLLGGYATVESILNRVDGPNKATRNDVEKVRQDLGKTSKAMEVMDTRVQAVEDNMVNAKTDPRIDAIGSALIRNYLGDCLNENVLRSALGEDKPVSFDQCVEERQQWYDEALKAQNK